MAKDSPSVEAIAALDQIIEGFSSFRNALQAALAGGGLEGSDAGAGSEVSAKPAARAGKAAPTPLNAAAGKGAGKSAAKGDAQKRTGKKAPPTVTFDELKAAFTAFIKEHGTGEAKTLLGTLGVERLGDLDEDQYADAMAGIEAAGANPEEEEEEAEDELL
jgi:hypothetical protein